MTYGFTDRLRQYGTRDCDIAADVIDELNATIRGAKLCSRGYSVEYGWNAALKRHGFYAMQRHTDWCEWAGGQIEDAWRLIAERAGEE